MIRRAFRLCATALAAAALMGCTTELAPEVSARGIGEFRLNHLVVIADGASQGALSRKTEDAVLKAAVSEAVGQRFARFDGSAEFSIGIKVVGYVLAAPGIPVLLAPRSMLLLNVAVFDADNQRINPEWRNMTIFEDAGGDTVVGSGYTQSAEEQLQELAENAAIEIEKWMRENEAWFVPSSA